MSEEESKTGNCEPHVNSNLLTGFKSIKCQKTQQELFLSHDDMQKALSRPMQEENSLTYLSGFFLKRLIDFHKRDCATCSVHGVRITDETEISRPSQVSNPKSSFQLCFSPLQSLCVLKNRPVCMCVCLFSWLNPGGRFGRLFFVIFAVDFWINRPRDTQYCKKGQYLFLPNNVGSM